MEDRSELFESKYVKQFIETFNNVLELMDNQEKEIQEYVGFDINKEDPKRKLSKN